MPDISWGPWQATTKGSARVGVEILSSKVSSTMTQITYTANLWTETSASFSKDAQILYYSGSFGGGSFSFVNNQAANTQSMRGSVRKTFAYAPDSYGTSPASWYISAKLGQVATGAVPTVTKSFPIAARPYELPAAVTDVYAKRLTDTAVEVHWTNHIIPKGAYQQVYIQRSVNGGSWKMVATLQSKAAIDAQVWVDRTTQPNERIQYRVRSYNSTGGSAWVNAAHYVHTTPAPPVSFKAAWTVDANGKQITRLTWDVSKVGWGATDYQVDIRRTYTDAAGKWTGWKTFTVNGGTPSNNLGAATVKAFDTTPPTTQVQYEIRFIVPAMAANASGTVANEAVGSAWVTSAILTVPQPPKAPVLISPVGGVYRDATELITFQWNHVDSGDGSDQRGYSIRWSYDNQNWNTFTQGPLVSEAALLESMNTMPNRFENGRTVYWQVATWGVHPNIGVWSPSAKFFTTPKPVVNITAPNPGDVITSRPVHITWDVTQAGGFEQEQFNGYLYRVAPDGTETLVGSTSIYTNAHEWVMAQPLENNAVYRAEIRVMTKGLWSAPDSTTFTVSFLPPAPVTIHPEFDCDSGAAVLTITADPPSNGYDTTKDYNWLGDEMAWGSFENGQTEGFLATNVNLTVGTPPTPGVSGGSKALRVMTTNANAPAFVRLKGDGAAGFPVTEGQTIQVTYSLWADRSMPVGTSVTFYDYEGKRLDSYSISLQSEVKGWFRNVFKMVVPAGAVYATPVIGNVGYTTLNTVYWIDTVVVEVAATVSDGHYLGQPERTAGKTSAVDFVDVQRRIDGGDWVTIFASAQLADLRAVVLDLAPTMLGLNEYRALVSTQAGGYVYTRPVQLPMHGFEDCGNAFVSWGENFSQVERAACNPRVSEKRGRARVAHAMIGRQRPMLMVGDQRTQELDVSFVVHWERPECSDDQTEQFVNTEAMDWLRMGEDAELVLYRDWQGRRVYGMISEVTVSDIENWVYGAEVSFTITRTDYYEGVIPRGNVDVAWELPEEPAPYDPSQDQGTEPVDPENLFKGINLAPAGGDFEQGVLGWQVHNGDLVEEAVRRTQGNLSGKLIATADPGASYIMEASAGISSHTIAPLQEFTVSYDYYSLNDTSIVTAAQFSDSSGAFVDPALGGMQRVTSEVTPKTWVRVVAHFRAPSTAAYVRGILAEKVRTNGQTAFFDRVMIELGNTPGVWYEMGGAV